MEFTPEELREARTKVIDKALQMGDALEQAAITWLWLEHLYDAAINSDLVGWENIEIARWLGRTS